MTSLSTNLSLLPIFEVQPRKGASFLVSTVLDGILDAFILGILLPCSAILI